MKLVFVSIVSNLLLMFRSTTSQCTLTGGTDKMGWMIKIVRNGKMEAHGGLVSINKVLSVFTPFIDLASNVAAVKTYELIGYEKTAKCTGFQSKKGERLFPPPKWEPGHKTEDVLDVAFWQPENIFEVGVDFPFLSPSNGDINKISESVAATGADTTCEVVTFTTATDIANPVTIGQREVQVTRVTSCKNAFCSTNRLICNLENRYDYCSTELRSSEPWERGAPLICKGSPIGLVADVGQQSGRTFTLYINLLNAWQIFNKTITTTTTTTTTTTPITEMKKITTTTGEKRTSNTKASEKNVSTTSGARDNADTSTTHWTTILTSRVLSPRTAKTTTTLRPTFIRTVPKHSRPASGSTLVIDPGVFALCAVFLYEGG